MQSLRKLINKIMDRYFGYRIIQSKPMRLLFRLEMKKEELEKEIARVKKIVNIRHDIPHQLIVPAASYSPWVNDTEFQSVYSIAKHYTFVDVYKMYELYSLVKRVAKNGGIFLEVGVWRGGSSAIIQKAIEDSKQSSKCSFYAADTFAGTVKADGEFDTLYKGGEHSDASIEDVKELFTKTNLKLPKILQGIFPDDHPNVINDNIVFLHIDVDIYQSTKDITDWAIPKLSSNAILIFDDYGTRGCEGVTRFCNKLRNNEDFIFLHNLNGHAVFIHK